MGRGILHVGHRHSFEKSEDLATPRPKFLHMAIIAERCLFGCRVCYTQRTSLI